MFNNADEQPIHIAISRGFFSVVVYLLSNAFDAKVSLRLDLSNRDYLPLLYAVLKSTNINECKPLLKAGGIPFALYADRATPLDIAINRGFTSIINLLSQDLPSHSDILLVALESQTLNILYQEDPYKWISIISLLVRNGADVHARDSKRDTLLHRAMWLQSEDHCLEVTKILIEAGCSASVRNARRKLPIEVAVNRGWSSVVEYLISHVSFDPDILHTVLEHIRPAELLKMVSLFIEHGADVSAISANGDTVLHAALTRSAHPSDQVFADVVDVLVKAGCNTDARDAKGRTPLELAKAKEYPLAAEYLRRYSSVSS